MSTQFCQYGQPGVGGRVMPCPRTAIATIAVTATDTNQVESMAVCQRHSEQMTTSREGTIYRSGTSDPVRVKL